MKIQVISKEKRRELKYIAECKWHRTFLWRFKRSTDENGITDIDHLYIGWVFRKCVRRYGEVGLVYQYRTVAEHAKAKIQGEKDDN